MKIDKKGNFFDFDQMASQFYDGGKYTAKPKDGTEIVGYIANCVAESKYYWNNNEIFIIFYGYYNKVDMTKKLKSFCKQFANDNKVVAEVEFGTSVATIKWFDKI